MNSPLHRIIGDVHSQLVFQRRVYAIVKSIQGLISPGLILDVGSGNGFLGKTAMQARNDIEILGADVHLRAQSFIPTVLYDGTLPFKDNTFSSILLIDVLHHTSNPTAVIDECLRVSKSNVIVKDHFAENAYQFQILKFMDWVGNRPYGVSLPYNYFNRKKWEGMINNLKATEKYRSEKVPGLYPSVFFKLLGSGIQFVSEIIKH